LRNDTFANSIDMFGNIQMY